MDMSKFNYSIKNELSLTDPGSSMNLLVHSFNRPNPKKPVFGEFSGASFPLSLRINLSNHTILEALSRRSGLSKNSICNEVLSIGFAYVLDHLDEASQGDIDDLTAQVLSEIIPQDVLKQALADSESVSQKPKTTSKK